MSLSSHAFPFDHNNYAWAKQPWGHQETWHMRYPSTYAHTHITDLAVFNHLIISPSLTTAPPLAKVSRTCTAGYQDGTVDQFELEYGVSLAGLRKTYSITGKSLRFLVSGHIGTH